MLENKPEQSNAMSEQHYYADVNLPLHVWVRERAGARGYRWVLRNAAEMKNGGDGQGSDGAARRPGAPLQLG